MDRKREIIVIDDGITSGLFGIGNLSVNLEVTKSGRVRKRVDLAGEGRITHGSICAAIIKKYAPGAVVGSIKVLDEDTNTGTCEQLVKALQWCLSKRIKIIHMSIGTIRQEDFGQITQIVNQLAGQGSIIVAACNNNDIYTIPACLPNVIVIFFAEKVLIFSFGISVAARDGILVDDLVLAHYGYQLYHSKGIISRY